MFTTAAIYDLVVSTQGTGDLAALQKQVQKFTSEMQTAQKTATGLQKPMVQAATSSAQLGNRLQNAAFQVGDFAVQVGGGVDATRALAQQLPQLLSGFGVFGAVAGAAAAILGPYVGSLISTKSNAELLEEATKKLSDVQDSNRQTIEGLTEEYGKHIGVMRELAIIREEVARADIAGALLKDAEAVANLDAAALNGLNLFEQLGNQLSNYDFGRTAIGQLIQPLDEAANKVNFLRDKFGLTENAAKAAVGPVFEFSKAVGQLNTDAAAAALAQLVDYVRLNKEEAAGLIPLLDVLQKQFDALAKVKPQSEVNVTVAYRTPVEDRKGDLQTPEAIEARKRAIEAEADARRKAAQSISEYNSQFANWTNTISRGTTPLQQAQFQLSEAEKSLAKFQSRMTPEQLAAANVYLDGLRTKIGEITQKDRWDQMSVGIDSVKTPLMTLYEQINQIGSTISDSLATGLSDAFASFIEGSKSAEEAFKEFAVSFLKQITQMIVKAAVLFAIQSALGGMLGGQSALRPLLGLGTVYGNGGVFRGGRELKKFANGGVVNSPTMFPMASGVGLMGEAGPEAIVPLTRRNGKLGVEASPVNVTVINNSSAQIRTRGSADGGLTIEVVEEAVATAITRGGNKIDAALSRGYGLRRAGR